MSFSEDAKNTMLEALTDKINYVTIYDEDGEEINTPEDEPQRQKVEWKEPAEGKVYADNQPEFTVPEETTVASVGYYDKQENGKELVKDENIEVEEYESQGIYRLTEIELEVEQ